MAKIFYVEDDINLSYVVKDCLTEAGHEVHHFATGDGALEAFLKFNYDLGILDVMLPKLDGFTLVKLIREKNPHIPIIFVSAKAQLEDKLEGLQLGGDDYLFKPFSIDELLLKIQIFLKRAKAHTLQTLEKLPIYNIGLYVLDPNEMELKIDQEVIKLTGRETELLLFFLKNKNRIIKRSEILIALWGKDDYFLGRSLDVFISRLRKFLSEDPAIKIENIPRVGFRFHGQSLKNR
ncbi:MAG: response regulator transcription factor [Saprospiraceae bacterium]